MKTDQFNMYSNPAAFGPATSTSYIYYSPWEIVASSGSWVTLVPIVLRIVVSTHRSPHHIIMDLRWLVSPLCQLGTKRICF